jgi:hypothetical protein
MTSSDPPDGFSAPDQAPSDQSPPPSDAGGADAGQAVRSGRAVETGVVRGSDARVEPAMQVNVWSFRLERYDGRGNRLPSVPVELRGRSMQGKVLDGDRVVVEGRWREGTLQARRVRNLDNGALVRARSYVLAVVAVLVVFVVLMVAGFVWVDRVSDANEQRMQREFCDRAREIGQRPPGC